MIKNEWNQLGPAIELLMNGQEGATITIIDGEYPVVVDQMENIKDLIKRGRYDSKSWIFSRVDMPKGQKKISAVTIRLARINQDTTTDKVCDLLTRAYYTPANIFEFLALGATYQALQIVRPIASIGHSFTTKDGYFRFVLTLDMEKGKKFLSYERKDKRILGLEMLEGVWPAGTVFAVVKI